MNIRPALSSLLLVAVFSPAVELPAQTKGTAKDKAPTTTSSRARSTEEKKPQASKVSETKPEASPTPLPAEKPSQSATPNKPVEESKPTENVNQSPTPEVEKDPVTVLRDKLAEAEGAERIRLQLKLAEELVAADKKTEALAELRAISATDVFDPSTFYNVGNSFARLGDNSGAIDAYKKAIEQRNGNYSRALNNLGVVLLRVGRWDESYEALFSALKLEGFRYPEASYNLGRLYAARGQNDLAVREWRRVLKIDPHHTAAADALAHVGTEDLGVVQPVRAATTRTPTPATTKPLTSSSRSPKTLALDPTSFDLLQRARALTEKGSTQESVDTYKRLLSRQGGYFPPANLELGFALISLKQYDEAMGNLQMVANRDGAQYPISYYHLARVFEHRGDLKQAEVFFSQAVSAFGTRNSQFLLDVSRVREKQGDFKGALEAMENYLTLMQQQGLQPSWSDERLTALRQKIAAAPKP
jgi:tetratricopeptide (TPR) repeat protein